MSQKYRIILIFITLSLLTSIGLIIEKSIILLVQSFWYSSGFLLLILMSLIDQPYFSKDSNIFVNAVTASLSLLLISESRRNIIFFVFLSYVAYLLISSYILMWIRKNPLNEELKAVQFISRINRILGKPDVLFSAFFLWGAIDQYKIESGEFSALLWFWIAFMLLNVPSLADSICKLFDESGSSKSNNIGFLFSVQSKNTFLVKLNYRCHEIQLYDFVTFKYTIDNKIKFGFVCEFILLNQEQWIKIITNDEITKRFKSNKTEFKYVNDYVYKADQPVDFDFSERFIGIVAENSTIDNVRFMYHSNILIEEGTLLEINIEDQKVIYQIVEGITNLEQLPNRNQSGRIIGEALQLGIWNNSKCKFDKFGWVPEINNPLYIASNIDTYNLDENEIIIGNLPSTNHPVILDKELAITHHTAIVGTTGTGKSVFSRNLIREYLKDDNVKVICIDFTGEYIDKFQDLYPSQIFITEQVKAQMKKINFIEKSIADNYNKHTDESKKCEDELCREILLTVNEYIKKNESNIAIFTLPEVENTSGVMRYTKHFFKSLFRVAKVKNNHGKRVCLALEEAHTVIPEWNFCGVNEKISQPLINSIAQIALQGRKYNIGLLVIAQRTANVSKTILTQCNSIISFQSYDKTSTDFLANYFGNDIASTLSKLRFRQAVASGKAFKSNVPMIFEVPEINEV